MTIGWIFCNDKKLGSYILLVKFLQQKTNKHASSGSAYWFFDRFYELEITFGLLPASLILFSIVSFLFSAHPFLFLAVLFPNQNSPYWLVLSRH